MSGYAPHILKLLAVGFYASVLLLIMNFAITLIKVDVNPQLRGNFH